MRCLKSGGSGLGTVSVSLPQNLVPIRLHPTCTFAKQGTDQDGKPRAI